VYVEIAKRNFLATGIRSFALNVSFVSIAEIGRKDIIEQKGANTSKIKVFNALNVGSQWIIEPNNAINAISKN
jgi:hypothetical protein